MKRQTKISEWIYKSNGLVQDCIFSYYKNHEWVEAFSLRVVTRTFSNSSGKDYQATPSYLPQVIIFGTGSESLITKQVNVIGVYKKTEEDAKAETIRLANHYLEEVYPSKAIPMEFE